MIRYKSTVLTIPAHDQKTETILTVGEGEKVVIKAIGRNAVEKVNSLLLINGDTIVDIDSELKMNNSNFIPVNAEVSGNAEIKVGGKSRQDWDVQMVLCLAYEEIKE